MIINSADDFNSFIISIAVGFFISIIYDIFKTIRIIFKNGTIVIIIEDILFSVIAAIITYTLLFVRVHGEIRWFILIAELIGFSVERIYISKFIIKLMNIIFKFIFNTVIFNITNFIEKIFSKINSVIDKLFSKISKKSLKH